MSSPARQDEAAAARSGPAEGTRPIVVGLLAAPGVAEDLAGRLARELPDQLHQRFPGLAWLLVVRGEVRAGPAGLGDDLVRLARERMLAEGWDLVICLTDIPLHVGHRPVTAYASVALGLGVVSVPALGAVNLESRTRETVVRLLERLLEHGGSGDDVRFTDPAVRGNLRLLVGMIRSNRPWEVIIRLSRALAVALGGAVFAIVSPGVWMVADGAGSPRLLVLAVGSVLATCASVIVAHRLWERSPGPAARERVVLVNLAVLLTTVLGVLTLYLALLVINAACVGLLIPSGVLGRQLGHPAGVADYLRLAWLATSLGTIGGALGAVVESDLAVREAVFGYRPDEVTEAEAARA
jgi:hypothetical protein